MTCAPVSEIRNEAGERRDGGVQKEVMNKIGMERERKRERAGRRTEYRGGAVAVREKGREQERQ